MSLPQLHLNNPNAPWSSPAGGGGPGSFRQPTTTGYLADAGNALTTTPQNRVTLGAIPEITENAEDPMIRVCLPREGPGFKAYKTEETEYGYEETVEFIKNLGKAWAQIYSAPRLLIGDLAVRGGGPTPKRWGHPESGFHKSHGSGLDFDVQIIRTDSVEAARSVRVGDENYDQERTLQLVKMIHKLAGNKLDLILSKDKSLKTTETPRVVYDGSHSYHLHVRLKR